MFYECVNIKWCKRKLLKGKELFSKGLKKKREKNLINGF